MANYSGTVEAVSKKGPFRGKFLYSVKLGDTWISVGEQPINKGDFVMLSAEKNAKGYLTADKDSIVVGENPNGDAEPNGPELVPYQPKGRYVPEEERQRNINIQSARTAAIEFVRLALEKEAIKLPATESKRLGVLQEVVNKLTEDFVNFAMELTAKGNQQPGEDIPGAGEAKNKENDADFD